MVKSFIIKLYHSIIKVWLNNYLWLEYYDFLAIANGLTMEKKCPSLVVPILEKNDENPGLILLGGRKSHVRYWKTLAKETQKLCKI